VNQAAYLPEIPEAAAKGSVADVYGDIRRVLGDPNVALIFRTLATVPGRLERICAKVLPSLRTAYGRRAVDELAGLTVECVEPFLPQPLR
jgi:hypothetical protein